MLFRFFCEAFHKFRNHLIHCVFQILEHHFPLIMKISLKTFFCCLSRATRKVPVAGGGKFHASAGRGRLLPCSRFNKE